MAQNFQRVPQTLIMFEELLGERTSTFMTIADLDSLSDESLMKRYGQGNMTAFENISVIRGLCFDLYFVK